MKDYTTAWLGFKGCTRMQDDFTVAVALAPLMLRMAPGSVVLIHITTTHILLIHIYDQVPAASHD